MIPDYFKLTCSMPPKGHLVCRRPGREPQREDADGDAAEVSQKMCCIGHDGQTAGSVSTCKEGNNNPSILHQYLKHLWEVVVVPLTNHLSSHEDEADSAGDEKLPPGQTSHVTLCSPGCEVRLPAEPVRQPQAVHAGGVITPL